MWVLCVSRVTRFGISELDAPVSVRGPKSGWGRPPQTVGDGGLAHEVREGRADRGHQR